MVAKTIFKVGDIVTTCFRVADQHIQRKVIKVLKDKDSGSGVLMIADGGEVCPHCGRIAEPTPMIDSDWFRLVKRPRKAKEKKGE